MTTVRYIIREYINCLLTYHLFDENLKLGLEFNYGNIPYEGDLSGKQVAKLWQNAFQASLGIHVDFFYDKEEPLMYIELHETTAKRFPDLVFIIQLISIKSKDEIDVQMIDKIISESSMASVYNIYGVTHTEVLSFCQSDLFDDFKSIYYEYESGLFDKIYKYQLYVPTVYQSIQVPYFLDRIYHFPGYIEQYLRRSYNLCSLGHIKYDGITKDTLPLLNTFRLIDTCEHRRVVLFLSLNLPTSGHANILLIDKNKGIVERFDPWGSQMHESTSKFSASQLDDELQKLCNANDWRYLTAGDLCLRMVQVEPQISDELCTDLNGLCVTFTLFYLEMRMKNHSVPAHQVANAVADKFSDMKPAEYCFFMRNYVNRIQSYIIADHIPSKYHSVFRELSPTSIVKILEQYEPTDVEVVIETLSKCDLRNLNQFLTDMTNSTYLENFLWTRDLYLLKFCIANLSVSLANDFARIFIQNVENYGNKHFTENKINTAFPVVMEGFINILKSIKRVIQVAPIWSQYALHIYQILESLDVDYQDQKQFQQFLLALTT